MKTNHHLKLIYGSLNKEKLGVLLMMSWLVVMFVYSSSTLFQTNGSAEEAETILLVIVGLPGHGT